MDKERYIEVVDVNDNIIGIFPENKIKKCKMIYRLIVVFVFNNKGDLFLQLRSHSKERYPDYYESSVGGHVEIGEGYKEAAKREMMEELGILEELDFICKKKVTYEDHTRFVSLFKCMTSKEINISKDEVDNGRFFKLTEINEMIKNNARFTPVFLEMFKIIYGAKNA